MSLTVSAELNGVCVPLVLDSEALAGIAAALVSSAGNSETQSTYLTIPEAAELLRCKRQRIDDPLSSGRLPRVKDGSRTLIARAEIDAYLRCRL